MQDGADFLIPARHVDRTDDDPLVAFARTDDALHKLGERRSDLEIIGQQALRFGIALTFDPWPIVRRVMAHHDRGRMIVPFDQQTGFFPDRQRNGADHARHALCAQPLFCRIEQRFGDQLVFGIEITEHARAGAHALLWWQGERQFVDMCGYTPDRLVLAIRDEELHARMFEKRIFRRIDQLDLFGAQLRHVVFFAQGHAPATIDEGRAALFVVHWSDIDCVLCHG